MVDRSHPKLKAENEKRERERVGSWFGMVKQCMYLLGAELNLGKRACGVLAGSVVGWIFRSRS
jgi:hypothetical protein